DAGDGALGPHPRRDLEGRIARAAADIENALAGTEPRPVHRPAAERLQLILDAIEVREPPRPAVAVPVLDLRRVDGLDTAFRHGASAWGSRPGEGRPSAVPPSI